MPADEPSRDGRPSPDALLAEVTREERTRLKVFVGAAPGVGKTYAMLQAARERLRDGIDVVVGIVETHGRVETEALLAGLEVVPRQAVEYRGRALTEMDLDAILQRRPDLVLVDELAHSNAPGSRHPKRWLDVEELLDAGIDVYTTVNIQHLESLNDVVAQITGVRVRETIPDRILDRADEVKLIDLSPEELIQRLQEGKVYVPEAAERALRNYFHPANLTALRELALRETAEHVDEQMQAHRRARAAPDTWAVSERVLVGIDGGELSERLVRAARRMAERRGVPWLAVFVEPPRFDDRPEAERERVHRALRLAEQLGGEAVTIPGGSVAEDLLRFARERNVSEIILGKSPRSRWRDIWAGSVIDQVIRGSGAIDVRVVSGDRLDTPAKPTAAPAPQLLPGARRRLLGRYAFAVVAIAIAGALAAGLMAVLPLEDPSLVFLAAVLMSALVGGLGPSIVASVIGLLVYDFFFVEPQLTLTVTKPQDLLSLFVFLLVAVLTSHLTSRVRDQADAARRRERRTAALYAFAREIAAAAGVENLLRVVVEHIGRQFGAQAVILMPDGGPLVVRARYPPDVEFPEAERGTATWVLERQQPAGRGTDTLPGGAWLHVPLATVRGPVGVLALLDPDPTAGSMSLAQRQLLEAMAGQAAVAIERSRIDAVLEAQAKLEAVIESIEDGLVVVDYDGEVQHVNEVACAVLGFEERAAIGRRFEDLGTSHPHYLRLRAAVAEFLAHPEREHEPVELALYLRGRDHYYMLRPTPLRARDGTHAGYILVLQDVTYLRDQEARREQLMATLSHELRTPLTSLRMATDLLARAKPPLEPEPAKLVDAAREDVDRLQDVAQRLLDVSRSRAMSIALERQHVDLGDIVARCARIFALQARERGVALETTAADTDLRVAGDPTKITWALSNLIANALRYTPRDGRVTLAAHAEDGLVRVSVADTGPGIPADLRERIFERFVQGPDDTEPGAAGLGLAIVRDIVQAHGGRIFLDSQPGRGELFHDRAAAGIDWRGLMATVLIVDDEKNIRSHLATYVRGLGHRVETAADASEALRALERIEADVLFADVRMPGMDGVELLREVRRRRPDTAVVLMTAYATVRGAVQAMRDGAYDYLVKPFDLDEAGLLLERLLEVRTLRRENRDLRRAVEAPPLLESQEPAMHRVLAVARQAAASDATVLLTGESGTGKNILAAAIHGWSPRAQGPFVVVSCTTLSEHLLESELFGHAKGAFTGAWRDHPGRLAGAAGGTVFLDEVGELPRDLQAKLLRFLEEHRFERVGETTTREVDVRIVAATNRDLDAEVREGRFRQDLFYRLRVIDIALPPLRERRADVPGLIDHLLQTLCARHRRRSVPLDPAARAALLAYRWPGNVRELVNALERALVLCQGDLIRPDDLPDHVLAPGSATMSGAGEAGEADAASLDELERRHVQRVLAESTTLEEAAARLGINATTLWRKRRRWGLD